MATQWNFIATTCLLLSLCLVADANHIDFVVDGSFFSNTDSSTGLVTSTQSGDSGNIIGGERDVAIDVISGTGFVSAGTLGASAGPGPVGPDGTATMNFSNSVTVLGQFVLTYDGVGTDGLGGADFDTNWDNLAVEFAAVQGSGELTLEVSDTSSSTGSLTLPVASAGTLTFPFADAAFTGVDFTAVDSVKFTLDSTEAASDFSIASITREVVPEPSSGLIAVLCIVPFLGLRRRRNA